MPREVVIDENSGFCFGVINAIRTAEEHLRKHPFLYCLGDIVHNSEEVRRLTSMGLRIITNEQLHDLRDTTVLIRAHGEPPETYRLAEKNRIRLIDATCPVVLQLQKKIKKQYEAPSNSPIGENPDAQSNHSPKGGTRGAIVIFGKPGHAEVLGLVGQTGGNAIVIAHFDDVKKLDFTRDIYLYSQTTKSLDEFHRIIEYIQEHISPEAHFQSFDTICRQVANRMPNISKFAARHDLILFVCGRKSSNGRVLFEECQRVNPNSHLIEGADEIDPSWLKGISTVGICGATSTPKWLMEQCREKLLNE